jgi:hypothetical protein
MSLLIISIAFYLPWIASKFKWYSTFFFFSIFNIKDVLNICGKNTIKLCQKAILMYWISQHLPSMNWVLNCMVVKLIYWMISLTYVKYLHTRGKAIFFESSFKTLQEIHKAVFALNMISHLHRCAHKDAMNYKLNVFLKKNVSSSCKYVSFWIYPKNNNFLSLINTM